MKIHPLILLLIFSCASFAVPDMAIIGDYFSIKVSGYEAHLLMPLLENKELLSFNKSYGKIECVLAEEYCLIELNLKSDQVMHSKLWVRASIGLHEGLIRAFEHRLELFIGENLKFECPSERKKDVVTHKQCIVSIKL